MNKYHDSQGGQYLATKKKLIFFGSDQEKHSWPHFEGKVGDDFIRIFDTEGKLIRSVFSADRLAKARRRFEDRLRKDPEMLLTAMKAVNFQF
jgi:hypothetical protein